MSLTETSAPMGNQSHTVESKRWLISGHVQGVGYRPFVYRLAHRFRLRGWVQNRVGRVEVVAQGAPTTLAAFGVALITQAPSISTPRIDHAERIESPGLHRFEIRESVVVGRSRIYLPPDYFTCEYCLQELIDPRDPRYRYPFINCTQCGPRYTIIDTLPYDRPNTTMAGFRLCAACQAEYENPLDRRFHAEPIACPACGPKLSFVLTGEENVTDTQAALKACVDSLRAGHIVAVKGIGGYHLLCDARNDAAVTRLRARKPRPHKPLAVMFPQQGEDGLTQLMSEVELRPPEAEFVCSPLRPIVLAQRNENSTLSTEIAPGLNEIGVMLPYSPLHHLLMSDFGGPLVATSGNLSGEPVLTQNADVDKRLGHVAEAFLHHNRPIQRPADDSVFRMIAGLPRPLRLGRGSAPVELPCPYHLPQPVLAVGGHLKNTIALGWDDRIVISPHIGDMGTPRSLHVFETLVEDLQTLYDVKAQAVVCDAHPAYTTTRWAKESSLTLYPVLHHRAHASALIGESGQRGEWLVFTWDGTGFGDDGTIWGGEALLGQPGNWSRVASMRPFYLPGGDRAGREPWRSAAALCWEINQSWSGSPEDSSLVYQAWRKRLNCPQTSAVGRLFDAAAALTGNFLTTSYEGQAPMQMEALSEFTEGSIPLPLYKDETGLWRTDWSPLVAYLLDANIPLRERTSVFHASMADTILNQAVRLREEYGVSQVGLCGGVFQNRVLTEQAVSLLEKEQFVVRLSERVPCNDGGISFGQIVEFGALSNREAGIAR